jgi:HEAT repeat protein
LLLTIIAMAVASVPPLRAAGWTSVAPTTALIVTLPSISAPNDPIRLELQERVVRDTGGFGAEAIEGLWRWQRWLLAHRCSDAIEEAAQPAAMDFAFSLLRALGPEARPAVPVLREVLRSGDRRRIFPAVAILDRIGPAAAPAAPELVRLVSEADDDAYWLSLALRTLGHFGGEARPATEAVIGIVNAPPARDLLGARVEAIRTLGRIEPDAGQARPVLLPVARGPSSRARAVAIVALARIDPRRPEVEAAIVEGFADPEINVRDAARRAASLDARLLERSVAAMISDLRSEDRLVRAAAARGLTSLGSAAAGAVPELCKAVRDEDYVVRLFATQAIAASGSMSAAATAALREAADDEDPVVRSCARRALDDRSTDEVER